eukprot:3790673-Amphidinium_carterae.3
MAEERPCRVHIGSSDGCVRLTVCVKAYDSDNVFAKILDGKTNSYKAAAALQSSSAKFFIGRRAQKM